MAKPTIKTRRAENGELIAEFSNGRRSQSELKGGLISVRELSDGRLCVELYRLDAGVVVRAPRERIESGENDNAQSE